MRHDLCSQRLEYVACTVAGALAPLAGAAARLCGRTVILVVLEELPPTCPAQVHQSLEVESERRPGHPGPATQGHRAPAGEGTTGISRPSAAPNQVVVG